MCFSTTMQANMCLLLTQTWSWGLIQSLKYTDHEPSHAHLDIEICPTHLSTHFFIFCGQLKRQQTPRKTPRLKHLPKDPNPIPQSKHFTPQTTPFSTCTKSLNHPINLHPFSIITMYKLLTSKHYKKFVVYFLSLQPPKSAHHGWIYIHYTYMHVDSRIKKQAMLDWFMIWN